MKKKNSSGDLKLILAKKKSLDPGRSKHRKGVAFDQKKASSSKRKSYEVKASFGTSNPEKTASSTTAKTRSSADRNRISLEKGVEQERFGIKPPGDADRRKSVITDDHRALTEKSSVRLTHSAFDPRFGDVYINKNVGGFDSYICCRLQPRLPPLSKAELNEKIHKLHKYCLIHLQDSYRVHLNRLQGIILLEEIIERAKFEQLTPLEIMSLIWCVLSCVHHFYIRLTVSRGVMAWIRRRQARRAMRTYEKLVVLSLPHLFGTVMRAIITFYSESKMWNTEYLCAELLKRLLYISQESESAVHAILDIAEKASATDVREARQVIRVLYQVLENYPWQNMHEHLIMRLLSMFQRSIMPEEDSYDYVPLRKGLEVCLRHVIENLPSINLIQIIKAMLRWTFDESITDEALLEFGNVLEYAAMMHETNLYRDSLYHDLFPLILGLVASDNKLHSLLGNRVLQHLIDRHNNRGRFDTPRIYYDDIHFDIVVSQYNSEDKSFIRKYREMIHTTLLTSIQLHGIHRINLESTYTSIAIFVVEIPCGYTAAAIVCLAMAIQEYALCDETLELDCSHRLHATVMAIMSLVCWVHSAQVFYDYLKSVVTRRAQLAPHLNPPLRAQYEYAQHHILWSKPELFFEDWEARYGLWKCFRTKRTKPTGNTKAIQGGIE